MQLNYYHIKIYKFVNVFSYSEIKIQTTERDGEQIRRQEVIWGYKLYSSTVSKQTKL